MAHLLATSVNTFATPVSERKVRNFMFHPSLSGKASLDPTPILGPCHHSNPHRESQVARHSHHLPQPTQELQRDHVHLKPAGSDSESLRPTAETQRSVSGLASERDHLPTEVRDLRSVGCAHLQPLAALGGSCPVLRHAWPQVDATT